MAEKFDPLKGFQFEVPQLSVVDDTIRLGKQMEEQRRAIQESIDELNQERWAAEDAKIEREVRALELSASILDQQLQLVDSQRQMLEAQQRLVDGQEQQSRESRVDRRIQYAILTITAAALVTTVTLSIAVSSSSVGWTLLAAALSLLAVAGVAALIVRGRRSRQAAASE